MEPLSSNKIPSGVFPNITGWNISSPCFNRKLPSSRHRYVDRWNSLHTLATGPMARSKASRPESSSWMLKNGIFGLLCVAQEEPFLSELLDSIGCEWHGKTICISPGLKFKFNDMWLKELLDTIGVTNLDFHGRQKNPNFLQIYIYI